MTFFYRVDPTNPGILHHASAIPEAADAIVFNDGNFAVVAQPYAGRHDVEHLRLDDGTIVVFARATYIATNSQIGEVQT